jgi:26S proteasome regulatory subunit N9
VSLSDNIVMDFIEIQTRAYPVLANLYNELGELYSKKQWHQLTNKLSEFLADTNTRVENNWESLYNGFIRTFEARLNQIRLATIISTIGHSYDDLEKALILFEDALNSRTRFGEEASFCLDIDTAIINIRLNRLDIAKKTLEEAKEKVNNLSSDALIFSKFYKATTEYRKVVGPPDEFYNAGLMYLAYTPLADMEATEAAVLAKDMALASITGDGIFNFGEVLATPILGCLQGTQDQWLADLVLALHHGSVQEFDTVCDRNKEAYFAQTILKSKHDDVKKKVVLLAVMSIVFERGSNDRTIAFSDIAARAFIPHDQVEWVLMRGMSLNLIKGNIDQVNETVSITWVLPRVLDKPQLEVICEQLNGWTGRVKTTLNTVEDETHELFC